MAKGQHGGKREGAGRPKKDHVKRAICLSPMANHLLITRVERGKYSAVISEMLERLLVDIVPLDHVQTSPGKRS